MGDTADCMGIEDMALHMYGLAKITQGELNRIALENKMLKETGYGENKTYASLLNERDKLIQQRDLLANALREIDFSIHHSLEYWQDQHIKFEKIIKETFLKCGLPLIVLQGKTEGGR